MQDAAGDTWLDRFMDMKAFEDLLNMLRDSRLSTVVQTTVYGQVVNAYKHKHPTSVGLRLEASSVALRELDLVAALAEC